jgi:ribosomal protein L31E|tara:strand:- start:456 stop:809 length:354 start_codon:yes stop_codon:yes gene_type:complete
MNFFKKKPKLEETLKLIRDELQSEFEGKLIFNRFRFNYHIWEEGARKIDPTLELELQPRIEGYEKKILSIYENPYYYGNYDMHIYIRDKLAENISLKHLNHHINQRNLEEINIIREF